MVCDSSFSLSLKLFFSIRFPFTPVLFSVSLLARPLSPSFLRECDSSFHIFVCAPLSRSRFCCSYTMSIFISCPIAFLALTTGFMAFIPFSFWIFTFLTELKIIFNIYYHRYKNDRTHLACNKELVKCSWRQRSIYESTCAWGRNRKLVKCENRS